MRLLASSAAAGMLAISLAIKLIVLDRPEPKDDLATQTATIDQDMAKQGFATRIIDGESVLASRGNCRLRIWPYNPDGTYRLVIERENAGIGRTAFAYQGTWLDNPPKAWPLLQFYVQRELARLGVSTPRAAILAVARAPACGVIPVDLTMSTWQR